MKKFLLMSFALCFALGSAWAQERVITGKVSSTEDGSSLPGVNVVLKGTTNGTVTDADGNYQITVPAAGGSLVFSFVGLTTQEVSIGDRNVVDIGLGLDVTQLSEVVVVGYGTIEKRKLSSSISTVGGAAIASLATPNFADQLAGRAAGMQVTVGTGLIGSIPTINIRGLNSISSGRFPLVVIDNVPMLSDNIGTIVTANPLAEINPADIESYEVLKDGAATAIYGSRAANGVILITTKRGKAKGKAKVEFNASGGYSEAVRTFDLANASQFESIANQKLANAGLAPAAFSNPAVVTSGQTDWQKDVIFRKGAFENYNVNVSGASDATTYYFSAGYQKQQSNIKANDYERFSALANLDHRLNKFLKVGTKIQFAHSVTTGLNNGSNSLSGAMAGGLRAFPNVTVYDPTNPTGYNLSTDGRALGQGANTRAITSSWTNQGFVLANNKFIETGDRLIGNAYAQADIIDGLSLKTLIGIDYATSKGFQTLDMRHGDGVSYPGYTSQNYRNNTTWNWQNTINYNKDFGDHGIDVVAGLEYQKTTTDLFWGDGSGFSDVFFQQNGLISGAYATQISGGSFSQNSFQSTFGRINYSYKDKYLLGASLRRDGISRLDPAQRYGTFYGGSIGYRVSEEDFYKNSGVAGIINDLKIRGSYAQVGNINIGLFPYATQYGSAKYGTQNGSAFTQAGNPSLRWETSKKTDIGLDMAFLNNKITFVFDWFQNDIDDIILQVPYAVSLGVPGNVISQNIGQMRNTGLEFTVGATPINKNGIQWNVSGNVSFIKNEVTATFLNTSGVYAEIGAGATSITARVGQPMNVIYGYEFVGVNAANGNPMYLKGNGQVVQRDGFTGNYNFYDPANPGATVTNNPAAVLSALDVSAGGDRKILGNTVPKWFGGLTNTVSYKGFSLEVFLRYSGGNYILNQTRQDFLFNQDFTNSGVELLNAWTPENPNSGIPRNYIGSGTFVNQSGSAITRFVEDGSFLKIQNVSLGYSLPKSVLEGLGSFKMTNFRIFAQVQNLATISGYKGLDPEAGNGFDNTIVPLARTYTIGLNIGL